MALLVPLTLVNLVLLGLLSTASIAASITNQSPEHGCFRAFAGYHIVLSVIARSQIQQPREAALVIIQPGKRISLG